MNLPKIEPSSQKRRVSKWKLRAPADQREVEQLKRALNLHPLTAKLLVQRGIRTVGEAERFLYPSLRDLPDPRQMADMERAVALLLKAIKNREKIVIYGDYDVDGITSTSVLRLFLREIGHPPDKLDYIIPHRIKDGYGLKESAFREQLDGCKLFISLDCGTSNAQEIQFLRQRGIEVIVVDHHKPPLDRSKWPEASAFLNPHRPDCQFPDKNLAAVGVTFQLVIALRRALREEGFFSTSSQPNLKKYLDLVALGTVADIVPLRGSNRIFVSLGLKQMAQTNWPGLQALMQISRILPEEISSEQISFRLAPRINATGRIGHAAPGVELLCTDDIERAFEYSVILEEENLKRQKIQEEVFREAEKMLKVSGELELNKALVLSSPGWHLGVIGIVASKLLQKFGRPFILVSIDSESGLGKGSARSIEGFDIFQALNACSEHLAGFGGHTAAAGLSIKVENLEEFKSHFYKIASEQIKSEQLIPVLEYDAELSPDQITPSLLEELELLKPYGHSNPPPVFISRGVNILKQQRTYNAKHVRLTLYHSSPARGISAIAFSQGELYPFPSPLSIAYTPQFRTWNGIRKIQLKILEFSDS